LFVGGRGHGRQSRRFADQRSRLAQHRRSGPSWSRRRAGFARQHAGPPLGDHHLFGCGERLFQSGLGILGEQRLEVIFAAALGALDLLRRFGLFFCASIPEPRPASGRCRERDVTKAILGADDVAVIGAVFDLAARSEPILLKRVVALDDVLQLESLGGVTDLCLAQGMDAAVDVLARYGGLELLDADEVLLVQRAQSLEPRLELLQRNVDVASRGSHAHSRSGVTRRLSKQTRTCQSLKPKCS
jgi:hypothetical protein